MFVILYIMIAGTVDSFVEGLGITLCCCCFDHRHGVAVLGVLTTVLASVRFGIARTIHKAIFVLISKLNAVFVMWDTVKDIHIRGNLSRQTRGYAAYA